MQVDARQHPQEMMAEVARIIDEWRYGPKLSETALSEIRVLTLAYESARSAEPVAPEIGEEEVARALEQRRRELIEQPLARIWPDLARVALALLQPALERARPAYSIAEPEGGFRAHGSFAPGEKAKLRPIAETLAMLDGNAFFGMSAGDHEDWSDQYLPEAAALYDANGGDGGWAGKASFAAAIRKGPGE